MITIKDLRIDEEAVAEKERFKQANDLVILSKIHRHRLKVGEFIKKFGYKYSRLNELKPHHFSSLIK